MQDLIFYVAANETLGAVRDYANMRNESAPTLVLGVSVCLRMRLFTERNVATPYPISAFSGIAAWNWSMDGDYDRSTTCKLTADAGSITVHSVTDSINGETMTFTEFVIPISTMNTEELTTWLGTAESKRGLTGELVGYDTDGNAVFVLQIENFTVRNRVAGIGEPTSQNQELVTRTEAQSMIQYAISGATIDVSNVTSAASAGYAVSAGTATSAGSATSAGYAVSAGGLTAAAMTTVVNSAAGAVSSVSYASSAGGLTAAAMTTVVNSAAGAVNITSVAEAGVASSLTAAAKADILASAGGSSGSGGTIIYSGGTADYASSAGSAGIADYASNAEVASSLTAAAKADILASAGGSGGSGGTIIYSGGTADYASSAGGLTSAAKADILSSAGGTASQGTLLTVTDVGDISASLLSNFLPTATSAVNDYSALGTVVRVDTIDMRWGGDSGLNAFAVPTANAVHAYVSSYVSSKTKYGGPFAVTTSGTSLKVAGGRMYLGGAEYAVGSTTLTSSNGTVYYYVYYSSGSYYSGCSVAASASALAAVIRGSQGYYTALANVQGGNVTQCHYGDIRIDGRVS